MPTSRFFSFFPYFHDNYISCARFFFSPEKIPQPKNSRESGAVSASESALKPRLQQAHAEAGCEGCLWRLWWMCWSCFGWWWSFICDFSSSKKQEQTNKTKHGIKYQTIHSKFPQDVPILKLNGNFIFPHSSPHEHSFSLKRARMMHPKKLLTKNHSFWWTVVPLVKGRHLFFPCPSPDPWGPRGCDLPGDLCGEADAVLGIGDLEKCEESPWKTGSPWPTP